MSAADWQISAARLSEFLRPAIYALAALVSILVFHDALRRRLNLYAVAAWTAFAFVLPHATLPLYIAARILRTRAGALTQTDPANDEIEKDEAGKENLEETLTDENANEATTGAVTRKDEEEDDADAADISKGRAPSAPVSAPRRAAFLYTLLYAALVYAAGAAYYAYDYASEDASLSRAATAKLLNQHERAIREYRSALSHADDAHTRKLLGVELLKAERWEEALTELRAAETAGEPDETIPFQLATALRALGRSEEVAAELGRFLNSTLCAQTPPDARCQASRNYLRKLDENAAR